MGKRYTKQEKQRIQELASQGHTDESIAQQLDRSTNAIRNYRHRTNIKTKQTRTIEQLNQEKEKITENNRELEKQINQFETRRNQVKKALTVEETLLRKKIETELIRLRDKQPELFTITIQDQINKLTGELASSFIRWLIEY